MRSDELAFMPASDLAALIRNQQVSPVEAVGAVLDRIAHLNPQLNAFCAVTADAARAEARAAEAAVLRGDRLGPLHGVPFSVKDLVITRGVRTGFGSRIFADNIPTEDAPVVERLKAAGGIMVGKTTTPEFGWKGTTDSPLTGISRNPWDLDQIAGRLQRRRRRRGGGRPGAAGGRNGWRRLDSHPGELLRHLRPEADLRRGAHLSDAEYRNALPCRPHDPDGAGRRPDAVGDGGAG